MVEEERPLRRATILTGGVIALLVLAFPAGAASGKQVYIDGVAIDTDGKLGPRA